MIFNYLVGLADGFVITCDGIEHDNKLWIVPKWLYHDTKEHAIPKRMIRFDNIRHQKSDDNEFKYLNITLSVTENELLEGDLPDSLEYIDNALHVRIPADHFPRK